VGVHFCSTSVIIVINWGGAETGYTDRYPDKEILTNGRTFSKTDRQTKRQTDGQTDIDQHASW